MNGHDETPEDGFNGSSSSPNPNAAAEQPALASPAAPPTQKRYIKGYEQRSFGRAIPQAPAISIDNTESINLKAPKRRPSVKKFLVVFGIIGVVVATIAVFFVMKSSNSGIPTSGVAKSFNEFANYFLYGEKNSAKNFDELSVVNSLYALEELDPESYGEFFRISEEKWRNFYNNYKENNTETEADEGSEEGRENGNSDAFDLQSLIDQYSVDLELSGLILQHPNLDFPKILSLFIKNPEEVSDYTAEYYQSFIDSGQDAIQEYGDQQISAIGAVINALYVYSANECINLDDNVIDSVCAANSTDQAIIEANNTITKFQQEQNNIDDINTTRLFSLYENIWTIKENLE